MPTMTPDMIAQLRDPAFLAQFQTTEELTEYLSSHDKAIAQGHTDGRPPLPGRDSVAAGQPRRRKARLSAYGVKFLGTP